MDSGYSPNDSFLPSEGGREMECNILSAMCIITHYTRIFSLRQGTPWQQLVEMTTSMVLGNENTSSPPKTLSDFMTALEHDAFLLLLGYGANVNSLALFKVGGETFTIPIWLNFLLYAVYLPFFSKHTAAYETTLDQMLKAAEPETWSQNLRGADHQHNVPQLIKDLAGGRTVLQTFAKSLSRLTRVERGKFAGGGDLVVRTLPESLNKEAFALLEPLGLNIVMVEELRRDYENMIPARGAKRGFSVAKFATDDFRVWKIAKRL